MSDDLLSPVFELADLVSLPCEASPLALLLLSAAAGVLAGLLLLADELSVWLGWLRSAEEDDEVRLGGFLFAAELSLAKRGGGAGCCCCTGGGRFWELEGRLLSTSAAKLAICDGSGRAALGGAL